MLVICVEVLHENHIDTGWCYLCKFYMNIILGNLTSGKTKSCCNSNGDNTQVTKTVEKNKLHSPSYSKQATARTVRDTEGLRETPEGKECLLNNHLEIWLLNHFHRFELKQCFGQKEGKPGYSPGKGKTSSKPSFSGSMLIFGGVVLAKNRPQKKQTSNCLPFNQSATCTSPGRRFMLLWLRVSPAKKKNNNSGGVNVLQRYKPQLVPSKKNSNTSFLQNCP